MSGSELQRVESYQYPATHVGHMNAEQQAALDAFKTICEKKGYYSPLGPKGEASHDDETMLRYLRARKFNPNEAFAQFKDTEDWRRENQLDKLYETIDVNEYEQTRVLYPQWIGRRDRRGIPVYLFEVAHLNHKAVSAYESSTSSKHQSVTSKVPVKMLRLFALYENLTKFALPLCSELPKRPYPETPVSQSNNIVDISNVGLRQFWNLKSHMQDASQLATAHYPETLDRIFIIGAPSFFPTVWGWVKRWFDPITVSKIFILSKENQYKTLEQYIAPENIPKQYGGKLDYKFGELPNMDPEIDEVFSWVAPHKLHGKNTIPTGPIKWERQENGDLCAVAVGSENGKPRRQKVAVLKSRQHADRTPAGTNRQAELMIHRTTSGVDTHPATPPADQAVATPPRGESPAPGPATRLPVREVHKTGPTQVSAHQPSTTRDGTSATRYLEQSHTHAHGTVADGTPEKREGDAGDSYGVMEPNTVGQAPKEHPMPEPEVEPVSYVDQAKNAAGQAYTTAASVGTDALAAVGLANKGEPRTEEAPRRTEDPAVDRLDKKNVEEFLRSQNASHAADISKEADA